MNKDMQEKAKAKREAAEKAKREQEEKKNSTLKTASDFRKIKQGEEGEGEAAITIVETSTNDVDEKEYLASLAKGKKKKVEDDKVRILANIDPEINKVINKLAKADGSRGAKTKVIESLLALALKEMGLLKK